MPHPAAATGPTSAPASLADPSSSSRRSGMSDSKTIIPTDQNNSTTTMRQQHPVGAEQADAVGDDARGLARLARGRREALRSAAAVGTRLVHERAPTATRCTTLRAAEPTRRCRGRAPSWPSRAAGSHQMSPPESSAADGDRAAEERAGPRELAVDVGAGLSRRARCRRTRPRAGRSPARGRRRSARPRRRRPRTTARRASAMPATTLRTAGGEVDGTAAHGVGEPARRQLEDEAS